MAFFVIFFIMTLLLSTFALNSMYSNSAILLVKPFKLPLSSNKRWSLHASKPVEVSFEPSGKNVVAEQGDLIEKVAKNAGVIIPFKCKQGRCNSCEVRLNGKGNTDHSLFPNRISTLKSIPNSYVFFKIYF